MSSEATLKNVKKILQKSAPSNIGIGSCVYVCAHFTVTPNFPATYHLLLRNIRRGKSRANDILKSEQVLAGNVGIV
jgi:hypothetical protein